MKCSNDVSVRSRAAALPLVAALVLAGSANGQCVPSILASADTPDRAFGVAVSGTVAYVADGSSGLQVIDVLSCGRRACCINDGCLDLSVEDCESVSGTSMGFGTTCATEKCPAACVADLDGTGAVDIGDLLRILTDWGPCPK